MALTRVKITEVFSLIFLIACTIGLSSCAESYDPEILKSPVYHEGYADGCATAGNQSNGFQSKIVENKARSDTNENYIIGWRQGFYACGGHTVDSKRYNNKEWHHDIGD